MSSNDIVEYNNTILNRKRSQKKVAKEFMITTSQNSNWLRCIIMWPFNYLSAHILCVFDNENCCFYTVNSILLDRVEILQKYLDSGHPNVIYFTLMNMLSSCDNIHVFHSVCMSRHNSLYKIEYIFSSTIQL